MHIRRYSGFSISLLVCLASLLPVHAGDPPASCTPAGGNGCNLTSDLMVFAEGIPSREIVGRITFCNACSAEDGAGNFQFEASLQIEFGPYTNTACNLDLDTVYLESFGSWFHLGAGSGGEATYIPTDGGEQFIPSQEDYLRTRCVDSTFLDYRIPELHLSGNSGAQTANLASNTYNRLRLPNNVRSTDGRFVGLDVHPVSQDLSFTHQMHYDETSTFRYWPDGMPFRLGAWVVTYFEDNVNIDAGPDPEAPTPYEVVPTNPGGVAPGKVLSCVGGGAPPGTCNPTIWNAGYLDSTAWSPRIITFDVNGMDLRLLLVDGESITYQPLFPQGTWMQLDGPATIDFADSRIVAGGNFGRGLAWLETGRVGQCHDETITREFVLLGGDDRPQVTADGGILAGVQDLNPEDGGGLPQDISWTVNNAFNLGCGTFWAPPPFNPVHGAGTRIIGPQREWVRSAVSEDYPGLLNDPSVDDRGIYAGFNYNRNRVCVGGDNDGLRCRYDTNCPGTPAGTCQELWSPMCEPGDPPVDPTWTVRFQAPVPEPPGYTPESFAIVPGDFEQEMAFHMRKSGITGVFDAGDVDFTVGEANDPTDQEFDLQFNQFGHAFLASQSEWSDTIIRGGLLLPYPSETTLPFNDMTMCNCGSAKSATTGEPPTENTLKYWSAKFYPHQIRFSADPPVSADCEIPAATACEDTPGSAKTVCVDASTPIPHMTPDADASWSISPNGQPGEIVPLKDPVYQFAHTHETLPPYTYHVERYQLSDWTGQQLQTDPYGFYSGEGQLALPYFGLPDAGIRLRRNDTGQPIFVADVLTKGDMRDDVPLGESHFVAERYIAADLIPLSYKIDYFPPEETADPADGDSVEGRGMMLGFSWDGATPNLNLGSIAVPAALVMSPNSIVSDLGPPASMRLHSATMDDGRTHLAEIMPAVNLDPAPVAQYISALGILNYPTWELPDPSQTDYLAYIEQLHGSGAIGLFEGHPDYSRPYKTSTDPSDPGMNASPVTGFLKFSPDLETVDLAYVDANVDTNGNFFAFNRANLTVDRHIKSSSPDQPIAQLGRKQQADNMALPGNMSIPFPDVPGMQWDFDYTVSAGPPANFTFNSLTGSLDLTKGGLSGIGFDKAGLTLKYWADGDWYFEAGLKLNFNGYGAYGDILLGNTKDMAPLQALDPVVADFLSGIHAFKGGYARVGVMGRIFDYGCLFRVSAGIEVGGWYITDSYGGKLRGWVSGKGACIVSVRGDVTLLAGSVGDRFKMTGNMWVAGGLGFCDEEDWDTPQDVLDDGWCAACVLSGSVTGITPPKFKLSMDGPDVECSL